MGQKGAKYLYYISRNLHEEYTGNCLSFESLSQMTLQRKYKLSHNFGSRFDFDLRGFCTAIFLEGVLEDIYTWNFISKWNSSRAKIIPVYGEMALTIKSRMSFRVNPLSIFAWISRNSMLETGVKSEFEWLRRDWNPQPLSSNSNVHKLNGWVFVYKLSCCGFMSLTVYTFLLR